MLKSTIFFVFTAFSSYLHAGSITISGLTKDQETIVRKGAEKAIARMVTDQVVRCIVKNSTRGASLGVNVTITFENENEKEGHIAMALFGLKAAGFNFDGGKHNVSLSITGESLGMTTSGRAAVGIVKGDKKRFIINVNKDMVGKPSHLSSSDFWAEVVSHEMLHNLSLRHGNADGEGWATNYAEYVITEWGYCTRYSGERGSSVQGFGLADDEPKYSN